MKVGFVGLGTIGKPMAVSVLKAGFDLMVFDARKGPVDELVRLGAKAARSATEVGEHADVVEGSWKNAAIFSPLMPLKSFTWAISAWVPRLR